MVAAVCAENLCIGLTTAAFVAWIIAQCDSRYSAFQFALLSSLMALSRVACNPVAGWLAQHLGWPVFFLVSTLFGLPGLLLLPWLRPNPLSKLPLIDKERTHIGNPDGFTAILAVNEAAD